MKKEAHLDSNPRNKHGASSSIYVNTVTIGYKNPRKRGVRTLVVVIMVGALLMKSSQLLLRPELFNLSTSPAPAKSLYLPSARLGVLDKTQNLQRALAQIADASNSDSFKFKEVVNEVLQRYASCHFAHLSATKCLSDEEKKYWDIFVEMMRSICVDPPALFQAYFVFTFYIKSLAIFIHGGLKAIKKIKYGDKCSKQLFREVLTRELERYDRGGETLTFANVDGVKCEKEAVGITHSVVDNGYTVVTILVLASAIYSIPPVVGSTENVKNVLQKFNTIPKSEIETLEVLQTPHTEDQGLSAQEVQKKFPLLKPLN